MNKADYPRCKTCKFWEWLDTEYYKSVGTGKGRCNALSESASDSVDTDYMPMFTKPDFGCIQHEPREDGE
jgi:hypothetical protein